MRRFLYYFPVSGMNPGMMKEWGVLDRFTSRYGGAIGAGGALREHVIAQVGSGPGGEGGGCVVGLGGQVPVYEPAKQRWARGGTPEKPFWVGIEELVPSARDLERETGIEGRVMGLADSVDGVYPEGGGWRVPKIRRWDRATMTHVPNLPKVMAMKPGSMGGGGAGGGGMTMSVRPEYAAVDKLCAEAFEGFLLERTIPAEKLFSDAAAILAVNYRIGAEEAGLLGILDEATALEVMRAAVDVAGMRAHGRELGLEGIVHKTPDQEQF